MLIPSRILEVLQMVTNQNKLLQAFCKVSDIVSIIKRRFTEHQKQYNRSGSKIEENEIDSWDESIL